MSKRDPVVVGLGEAAAELGLDRTSTRRLFRHFHGIVGSGTSEVVFCDRLDYVLSLNEQTRQREELRIASARREDADRDWSEAILAAKNLTRREIMELTGINSSRLRRLRSQQNLADYAPLLPDGRKAYLCQSRENDRAIAYGKDPSDARRRFRGTAFAPVVGVRRATRGDMQTYGGWWGGGNDG
jgi:hypothetical protein